MLGKLALLTTSATNCDRLYCFYSTETTSYRKARDDERVVLVEELCSYFILIKHKIPFKRKYREGEGTKICYNSAKIREKKIGGREAYFFLTRRK